MCPHSLFGVVYGQTSITRMASLRIWSSDLPTCRWLGDRHIVDHGILVAGSQVSGLSTTFSGKRPLQVELSACVHGRVPRPRLPLRGCSTDVVVYDFENLKPWTRNSSTTCRVTSGGGCRGRKATAGPSSMVLHPRGRRSHRGHPRQTAAPRQV